MTTLVLTVIGDDRSGLVNALAAVVADHRGNWERSQMAELGGAFAGIVLVEVAAERAEAFRAAASGIEGLQVSILEADGDVTAEPADRVSVELLGNDRPGIVRELTAVFARHGVSIEEFESDTTEASMSGGRLFQARISAPVAAGADLDALRADLERLASELMVDITVEDATA